eukprot:1010907-Pyramimonas_sp.AAC.1
MSRADEVHPGGHRPPGVEVGPPPAARHVAHVLRGEVCGDQAGGGGGVHAAQTENQQGSVGCWSEVGHAGGIHESVGAWVYKSIHAAYKGAHTHLRPHSTPVYQAGPIWISPGYQTPLETHGA